MNRNRAWGLVPVEGISAGISVPFPGRFSNRQPGWEIPMDVNWETIILAGISALTGAFGIKGFDFLLAWKKGTKDQNKDIFRQYDSFFSKQSSRIDNLEKQLEIQHEGHMKALEMYSSAQAKVAVLETTIRLQAERINELLTRIRVLEGEL